MLDFASSNLIFAWVMCVGFVSVPSGSHSITLTVKDKDQHTVEKQIKFRVE